MSATAESYNGLANFCVLEVEDDPNDVLVLAQAFRMAEVKHRLEVVRDGVEAVDYLSGIGKFADRRTHLLPCLVILDQKMPRMTGLEVLEWIRQESELCSLPVIMFSSSSEPEEVDRAYELGANSYVVKPATMNKTVELAGFIKGYWLQFNELPPRCNF